MPRRAPWSSRLRIEVDTVEQVLERTLLDHQRRLALGGEWQPERATIKPLVEQAQPGAVVEQHLQRVAALAEEDEEEWERRVMELASTRVLAARARLERLGIIDATGKLVSTELPFDMMPESDATLETG